MRAVVYDRYGGPEVLHLEQVEKPVPEADEVLVMIRATTVNRTDVGFRSGQPFISKLFTGIRRPRNRILGMEFAGDVEATGGAVTAFKVGDQVFGGKGHGAHAEFICIKEGETLAHKPAGMSFEEAASVTDGAMLALVCLRAAGPLAGRRVLIYGASGAVGTAAIQLAKHFGADVIAVVSTKHVDLARSLGADDVIDYKQADFTKNGKTYDVIFDSVGQTSFRRCLRSLKLGGTFVETDPGFMWNVPLLYLLTRWVGDKKVKMGIAGYRRDDLLMLRELIEAGKYRSVVDRTYPLEEAVEAHRYVELGHKTGNVVLRVRED
jgi:NADPH:quinone reductase-like Zn-dependent oxidoreductase